MNKEQYMKLLKKRLHRLPKADFDKAVEYYEEYFAEAGAEHEQQAIEDLGDPEKAAEQIIMDLAINNTKEPVKDVKKGLNAVWVGILAICAAPVALPVLFAALVVVAVLILLIFFVLVVLLAAGASIVFAGPFAIIGGLSVLTENLPACLICIGYGLMGVGMGLIVVYAMYHLCRGFLNKTIKVFGNMVQRGGKKHE